MNPGRWSLSPALGDLRRLSCGRVDPGPGAGFDLLVRPPDIAETLDFPGRLEAFQPFRQAVWPIDVVSTLLFVGGFGAL